jgi:hypothetical protein
MNRAKESILISTSSSRVKPVFPDGKTLKESSNAFETSLRSYGSNNNNSTPNRKKSTLLSSSSNPLELSPVFRSNKGNNNSHKDSDGRPSIGTITSQWEFMRTNFVNNSDEELEWLMVSKKQGAYHYANRKNEQAEDKYFKSLYEIDFFESKIKYFVGFNAKLPTIVSELAALYNTLMATPKDEITIIKIQQLHEKMTDYMKEHETQQIFAAFGSNSNKIEQSAVGLIQEQDRFKIVRKARDLHANLSTEIVQLQGKLMQAKKDSEESLKNMEKWSKRSLEADEYPTVMRNQEQTLMEQEYDDNMAAYRQMRAYYPHKYSEMGVTEIMQEYVNNNGLISMELAQELKQNRLLQWLEMHPDDIVFDNFLSGEKKTYFENLESLDLVEMRAIATIIPPKFELDPDNRKQDWRSRFFLRYKQMMSQYRREKVKGAWDATKNCRSMVDLPMLKPEQLRRSVYFFRTKEQSDVKLKQFDDKLASLVKKRGKHQNIVTVLELYNIHRVSL